MPTVSYKIRKDDTEGEARLQAAGWTETDLVRDGEDDYVIYLLEFESWADAAATVAAIPDAAILVDSSKRPLPRDGLQAFMTQEPHSAVSTLSSVFEKIPESDAKIRRRYLRAVALMAEKLVEQAEAWKKLAFFAAGLSVALLVFSGFVIRDVAGKVQASASVGYQLIGVIFALTVFVASPGVLFLLGRPLKGVDEWTPDGVMKSEKGGKGDDVDKADEEKK
ncbi:hypothetical protein [Gordonia sp. (in: high G+C Gram-positive bacteria)]|jgi:hypothetical protein|uniref:hypothetical protein n=1 Tax=Gordonia sp. (in: high G+C Gram-positive bacteria) TaxID=84139 RepID=UPI001D9A833B|nr:hypothetical protein [Gordonia sp. (in: high G+C Gram-positive bacteria)]MCB1294863.1 hypothetical protein [Gordonia sp. (in: high G+C Gram-positive bacteria)]HMS74527.1 hypothetical protein [Gordonia sp. (in: high G+C Gram-positive bacteria)]HQV16726.1 hypothetical protein [Gordonia sp. (in: high G+C Gram-positive bacteria)]